MSTTASRRGLLGAFALLPLAAIPVALPAIAGPNPDAALIALCNRVVELRTEWCLLAEHDPHAPDEGPNHLRYDALVDEEDAIVELLLSSASPTTPDGREAVARVVLALAHRDHEGNLTAENSPEWLAICLARATAIDFVYPPALNDFAGKGAWFPPYEPPPFEPVTIEKPVLDAREKISPQKLADAGMKMFSICWANLREAVADAGGVITFDDLRAMGMPIPPDVVGVVA